MGELVGSRSYMDGFFMNTAQPCHGFNTAIKEIVATLTPRLGAMEMKSHEKWWSSNESVFRCFLWIGCHVHEHVHTHTYGIYGIVYILFDNCMYFLYIYISLRSFNLEQNLIVKTDYYYDSGSFSSQPKKTPAATRPSELAERSGSGVAHFVDTRCAWNADERTLARRCHRLGFDGFLEKEFRGSTWA